ncbi:Ger(x)C family spore germination protein [Lysinibacillus sp. NPDC048646]|uniref:Ger(x)C family spore germination protein n=1 Tax=Lysinibacillus sp. NPDC048646 TaxID=3390574 RepID=UPI003CFC25AA
MIKIKKSVTLILLILFCLLLSGCWSKRELNELAIVLAFGVDKIDDEYQISVQIVNPSETSNKLQSSTGRSPVVTFISKGESILDAVKNLSTVTPRKAYFAHLQIVVIGEELANEGIKNILDLLARNNEVRDDFSIIIGRNAYAKDILTVLTPIEKIPAYKLIHSLKVSEKDLGSSLSVNLNDLMSSLESDAKSSVLSVIEIKGDTKLGKDKKNVEMIETPALLQYTGLALIKEYKLIGFLAKKESKSLNYLKNNINSTVEIISCPKKGDLTTVISNVITKTNGKIKEGKPTITVHIDVEQKVGEVNCEVNLTDEKTLQMINNKTANLIEFKLNEVLNLIQNDYQIDVLEYSEVLHRADPEEWKKLKNQWTKLFPELEVNIKIDVKTIGFGTIQNWEN